MTKITFGIVAICGLLTGIVWGHYTAREASQLMETLAAQNAAQATSRFAAQQFSQADTEHARIAVLAEIAILEELEQSQKTSGTKGQLAYAYTRLGLIDESAGHLDKAGGDFEQAKLLFKRDFGHEVTKDQMRDALLRIDKTSGGL